MEIVKLTAEQAEAIESIKGLYDLDSAVEIRIKKDNYFADKRRAVYELSLDDFIRALYIGYEIKKTPEECLYDYYYMKGDKSQEVIKLTLDILNIKVKGINDNE